ncbi:uncharacterized protein LOC111077572 [Drosophila obscura]|uniref:uncharacterized protein LOC111077572 n=1 Tax=Drosophila obscura TaxID=7282 RepID=UPI001BB2093C|nr:uncharacterized protein LOC111077572 [Drosophila obscura]
MVHPPPLGTLAHLVVVWFGGGKRHSLDIFARLWHTPEKKAHTQLPFHSQDAADSRSNAHWGLHRSDAIGRHGQFPTQTERNTRTECIWKRDQGPGQWNCSCGNRTNSHSNDNVNGAGPAPAPAPAASAVHVRRIRRRTIDIPVIALDYMTGHMPCDMDIRGIRRYITAFPNQCIWSYNNRYTTEGYYRVYKMYQLEAFFFGQYHERLKRYETEPHNYDAE